MLIRKYGLWTVAAVFAALPVISASGQTIIPDPQWRRPTPLPRIVPPQPHPHPRPRPPQRNTRLQIKKHAVEVSIVDGVAVTNIDQIFFNPYAFSVEGTYIFPLEDDVALNKFTMFINGQEVEGKLLSVEEARRTYESIVARLRDPALLEYIGTRMFQARMFPIEPKGEARVRLSYTQMLHADDGLVRYRYPLGTERHLPSPVESVSVVVNLESSVAIKSTFSPTHKLAIHRESDHKVSASFEATNVYPDKDFELYYALSDKEFGLTVLTFRESGEDGFFLARIAPPAAGLAGDVLAKDISFVIDVSGSMAGVKLDQAKAALKFCLSNLNKQDRFNIIPFSHEPRHFRETLVPASPTNIQTAQGFVSALKADGGTNINDALVEALAGDAVKGDSGRPYMVVFVTDGLPTIGVTHVEEILSNVASRNSDRVRLFVFGVGNDVNTKLLDLLAEQNRGARDYVAPNEDLELKLSSFFRKISNPVLADLRLTFGGLSVTDLYPPKLGDLFSGSEIVVLGRYKGEGAKALELTGKRRGKSERFVYETTFPAVSTLREFLPRLWATRKVGFLLDEMRLHGENKELKDTIVTLAMKYGIVTPYTAYLVTEPGSVAARGGGSGRRFDRRAFTVAFDSIDDNAFLGPGSIEQKRQRQSKGKGKRARPFSGAQAVADSQSANMLRAADSAPVASWAFDREEKEGSVKREKLVERVGTRTFYRVDDRWVDSAYDESTETTKVESFSKAYFELVRKHPELAKCFALGERIIVVVGKVVYETVPPAGDDPETSD